MNDTLGQGIFPFVCSNSPTTQLQGMPPGSGVAREGKELPSVHSLRSQLNFAHLNLPLCRRLNKAWGEYATEGVWCIFAGVGGWVATGLSRKIFYTPKLAAQSEWV